MARVRQRHTAPELQVRKALHNLGLRFRLHCRDLPGTPDIVLPRLQTAILVNGCFWHRHEDCVRATTPKTRTDFWNEKFDANVARDQRNVAALERAGLRVLVIWECETENRTSLDAMLRRELIPA